MTDGRVSCCGTANMDIRSFELNFEVNATIYDENTTETLEEAFLRDLDDCREITKEVIHPEISGFEFVSRAAVCCHLFYKGNCPDLNRYL